MTEPFEPLPIQHAQDARWGPRIPDDLASAPRLVRYGLALAFARLAIVARDLLTPSWGADVKLIMFVPPVLFAAWFGGLGAGLLTTAACALGATYLWLSPAHGFRIADA
jgi:hypothetical protein